MMPVRDCFDIANIIIQALVAIGTISTVIVALNQGKVKLKISMFPDGRVVIHPDGKEEHVGDYVIRIANNCSKMIKISFIGFKGPRGHNFTLPILYNMEPFILNPGEDKSIKIPGDSVRVDRHKLNEILYVNDALSRIYYVDSKISIWIRIKRFFYWRIGRL